MTRKQQEEIEYLTSMAKSYTQADIDEYLQVSVHGGGASRGGKFSENPIWQAQRNLNITLAMWAEDIYLGLIAIEEILEEENSPYIARRLKTIVSNKSARRDFLEKEWRKHGSSRVTVLSITNTFEKST